MTLEKIAELHYSDYDKVWITQITQYGNITDGCREPVFSAVDTLKNLTPQRALDRFHFHMDGAA